MVGHSVGALGLEADVVSFIISDTEDERALGEEGYVSESSEIYILLEK
jgi:hypothetical protein